MSPNPKIECFIDDICNRCSNATFNIVQDENISGAKESERFCEDKKLIRCLLFQSKKRYLIGFFESKESAEYGNFRKVAANLKDDCVFMAGFGNVRQIANVTRPCVTVKICSVGLLDLG